MDIRLAAESALGITLEGLGVEVTFTERQTLRTQVVKGQVTRVDTMIDPQTGVRVYAPNTAVTVRLSSLSPVPDEEWEISTTDVTGNVVSGYARAPVYDRTMGTVTYQIEEVDDAD